jgi:type VI secretion system secreted protein VgrG
MSTSIHAPDVKIQITGFDKTVVYSQLVIEQSVANHHHFSFLWNPGDFQSDANLQSDVMNYIGRDVSISLGKNKFKGIVTEIIIEDLDDSHTFHISGQSPTILLDDAPRSTSYYKQNLQQIIQKSLIDTDTKLLKAEVKPFYSEVIQYLAHYNETDFTFLKRLAIRFGEWFYYDGEKICFGDTQNGNLTLKNGSDIQRLAFHANLQVNKYSYAATDSHKGVKLEDEMSDLKFNGDGFAKTSVDKSKILYSRKDSKRPIHAVNIVNKMQLDHVKKLDSQRAVSRSMTITGQSTVSELKPGYRFKFDIGGNTPEFIILSVSHKSDHNGNYSNSFSALPSKVEVPPYTDPHAIRKSGMQPAIVKDNKDSDKQGRVKVKFAWSDFSPWMRISTPHSGKDKGWHFVPEIGEDVMVDFEGNDVDKPFVIGSLYQGNAKSGLGDDTNDIKSLKTRSGNTIILNDKEGSITIQDPKGSVLILKGDETIELSSKTKIIIKSKDIDIKAEKNINIEAGETMTLKSGKAMQLSTQDTMKQESMKEFKISTMDNLSTSSMKDTKVSATMNLTLEGTMKAEMKGLQASVEGSAQATVKAAIVMIN